MNSLFQSEYERTRELVQAPDWYMDFGVLRKARLLGLGALQAAQSGNIMEAALHAQKQTVAIFQRLLEEQQVRLGIPGEDELDMQDEGRLPIDTVVIHHSSRAGGISLEELNALHLLRLYVPRYQDKKRPIQTNEGELQPIYSGHFSDDGQQVFYGYHWKVGQDGTAQRLLKDEAIGWHAGDWKVNTRSVAICIDDDLRQKAPSDAVLDAVAGIMKDHYPSIAPSTETVRGHNEYTRTMCPGVSFLNGWRQELIRRASAVY